MIMDKCTDSTLLALAAMLALVACMYSFTAIADNTIYQWQDANGRTHYSDQLPANTPVRELDPSQIPLSTIGNTALREAEKDLLQAAAEQSQQAPGPAPVQVITPVVTPEPSAKPVRNSLRRAPLRYGQYIYTPYPYIHYRHQPQHKFSLQLQYHKKWRQPGHTVKPRARKPRSTIAPIRSQMARPLRR